MSSTEIEPPPKVDRRAMWLAIAFFAGPFAWFSDLLVSSILVPAAQREGSRAMLFVVTFVAVALVGGGAAIATHILRSGPREKATDGTGRSRERFFAIASLVACAFFFLVIAGNAVPRLVHGLSDR